MKLSVLYSIGLFLAGASASCTLSSDGNYYCGSTKKVTYTGIGYSGNYNEVTSMDSSSGSCSSKSFSFSGNLSPLDEELSLHFRGPIKLKQFGVYYPVSSSDKKKRKVKRDQQVVEDCHTTLVHKHHLHKRATQVVEVTQTVYVDANGVTQTSATTATATKGLDDVDTTSTQSTAVQATSSAGTTTSSSASSASSSASSDDDDDEGSEGDWKRSAYYTPGTADGVVFLNHNGGSGSGVWDSSFGNSISYANEDATGGSSSPVTLGNVLVESNVEFLIMSDSKCGDDDEDSDCGFYREGIPAYHGFKGSKKIFVFEFQMPTSSQDSEVNYDMPAIWALNAKIPRTLQYGSSSCTCWPSCGELDLFEILSSGSDKLISHLHSSQGGSTNGGGGSQDYFDRPTDSYVKAAVVFDGSDVSIVYVDDDFDSVLSQSTVDSWVSESGSKAAIQ